jgi:magnesium-transporting ATPase (P-type)
VAIEVNISGQIERWERLAELAFTSDRKRMTVILRETSSGRIVLHSKGADDVIFARTAASDPLREVTEAHVETFAALGLRTLVFGLREMSEAEWSECKAGMDKAAAMVEGRSAALSGQSATHLCMHHHTP